MCKSCNKIAGHNSRTCEERLKQIQAENATTNHQADQQDDTTKRRLCSVCNKREKHNARTCPNRTEKKMKKMTKKMLTENRVRKRAKLMKPRRKMRKKKKKTRKKKKQMKKSKNHHQKRGGETERIIQRVGKRRGRTVPLRGVTRTTRARQKQQQTLKQMQCTICEEAPGKGRRSKHICSFCILKKTY